MECCGQNSFKIMIANSLEHKSKKKKKIISTLELRFSQLHERDFETRKMRRAIGPHVPPLCGAGRSLRPRERRIPFLTDQLVWGPVGQWQEEWSSCPSCVSRKFSLLLRLSDLQVVESHFLMRIITFADFSYELLFSVYTYGWHYAYT